MPMQFKPDLLPSHLILVKGITGLDLFHRLLENKKMLLAPKFWMSTLVALGFALTGCSSKPVHQSPRAPAASQEKLVQYPDDKVNLWIKAFKKSKQNQVPADKWPVESWLGYHFSSPDGLQVTEAQTIWAMAYKKDYYIKLNSALRKQDQAYLAQFHSMVEGLDGFIAAFKPVPEDIHVFRVQNDRFHPGSFRVGEVCLLRAYTSTSLRDSFPLHSLPAPESRKIESRDDIWIFTIQKGSKGLFMNALAFYEWDLWQSYFSEKLKDGALPNPVPYKPVHFYEGKGDEDELLLPRNSWIQITAIHVLEEEKYTQIKADLIGPPQSCNLDPRTSCCS